MRQAAMALVVVLLAGGAQAQDDGQRRVMVNTVSVGADGKFEAAPDTAVVQFNLAAQGDSSQAAYEKASKAAERMRQAMRDQGLDPKQAQLGFYSLQPMYDYKSPKRKIVGYVVSTQATIKLKDFT